MSNIFQALNRTKNHVATVILPSVGARHRSSPVERDEEAPEVGAPAVGKIRSFPLRISAPSPIFPFDDGNWQASEQYRTLRAKLVQHHRQPRLIVISSPAPKDGKSVSAINIAGALSLKEEARVLLLDADMRQPMVHLELGLPKDPGLTDVLTGVCPFEEALVQTQEFPNLYVMTAGSSPANPAELLERAEWPALCARLRKMFRYIIVDSPPLGAVADFDLIQAECDGVILVVRPDQTQRQLCYKALEAVAKDKYLGMVLNCVRDSDLNRNSSYYYYAGKSAAR